VSDLPSWIGELPPRIELILVTGSRDWPDPAAVTEALEAIEHHQRFASWPITLMHGGNGRVDAAAHLWARRTPRWFSRPFPALWADHPGRSAGPRRNRAMVQAGPDLCLAFIGPCTRTACAHLQPHGSHGASGCADLAQAAGIPTWRCFGGRDACQHQ